MFCLGLLGFLHGLTVRMYRLSPVPVSLVPFPIFPTAPSHSSLLGKVNRPKHSSPFSMVAHCFSINSNALTFLRRLFFALLVYCEYQSHSPEQYFYSYASTCQPSTHLSLQIPDYYAFLFFCVCPLLSHLPPLFCFLGAS